MSYKKYAEGLDEGQPTESTTSGESFGKPILGKPYGIDDTLIPGRYYDVKLSDISHPRFMGRDGAGRDLWHAFTRAPDNRESPDTEHAPLVPGPNPMTWR